MISTLLAQGLLRYKVPPDRDHGIGGWGIFVIGQDGYFSVVSDYGNYAYLWRDTGGGDFRRFLIGCDPQYVGQKLAPDKMNVYDQFKTINNVKNLIIEGRRNGYLTKSGARLSWASLTARVGDTIESFNDWARHNQNVFDQWELMTESVGYAPAPMISNFIYKLFPRFVKQLKDQLAYEEALNTELLRPVMNFPFLPSE